MNQKLSLPQVTRSASHALTLDSLIKQAIDILDQLDGVADLENGRDREPSLASLVGDGQNI